MYGASVCVAVVDCVREVEAEGAAAGANVEAVTEVEAVAEAETDGERPFARDGAVSKPVVVVAVADVVIGLCSAACRVC